MSMPVAVTAVMAFLIAYTAGGALLAMNRWHLATWASEHDFWHRSVGVFRASGFMMAGTGPPMLGFVLAEVLRSR